MNEKKLLKSGNAVTVNQSSDYEDLLGRKEIAVNFLEVVKTQTAKVYSINAPWGGGKTWFLKFIEQECNTQNIPFIQFNVWETDYAKDPFQAILFELIELLNKQIKAINNESEADKLKNELNDVETLAQKFVNLRKRASFGVSVGLANVTINPDESSLCEYLEMKNAKKEFIDKLKSFAANFKTKLIIAIDELDRCRPDYAISTLEIIKHFFDIENIVFLLAVDKEQLQNTVRTMFGQSTDTDSYLKKFVDVDYSLPVPETISFIHFLANDKYPSIVKSLEIIRNANKLLTYNKVSGWQLGVDVHNLSDLTLFLATYTMNLSLRDLEKLALKLSIILPLFVKRKTVLYYEFLIMLVYLSVNNIALYNKLKGFKDRHMDIKIVTDEPLVENFKRIFQLKLYREEDIKKFYTTLVLKERPLVNSLNDLMSYFDKIDFAESFS